MPVPIPTKLLPNIPDIKTKKCARITDLWSFYLTMATTKTPHPLKILRKRRLKNENPKKNKIRVKKLRLKRQHPLLKNPNLNLKIRIFFLMISPLTIPSYPHPLNLLNLRKLAESPKNPIPRRRALNLLKIIVLTRLPFTHPLWPQLIN